MQCRMLVRCGGNVVEVGRRQAVVMVSAGLVLLTVTVYFMTLVYAHRSPHELSLPTPLDGVLGRRRSSNDQRQRRQPQQRGLGAVADDDDNPAAVRRRAHDDDGLSRNCLTVSLVGGVA